MASCWHWICCSILQSSISKSFYVVMKNVHLTPMCNLHWVCFTWRVGSRWTKWWSYEFCCSLATACSIYCNKKHPLSKHHPLDPNPYYSLVQWWYVYEASYNIATHTPSSHIIPLPPLLPLSIFLFIFTIHGPSLPPQAMMNTTNCHVAPILVNQPLAWYRTARSLRPVLPAQ